MLEQFFESLDIKTHPCLPRSQISGRIYAYSCAVAHDWQKSLRSAKAGRGLASGDAS